MSCTFSGPGAILENFLHGLSKGSLPFSLPVYSYSHADISVKLIKPRSKFPELKSAAGKRIISGSRLKHSSVMQENRIWKQALIWHCLLYCCWLGGTWAPKNEREALPTWDPHLSHLEKKCIERYKKHHVLDTASCIKLLFWCLLKWNKQI